jgi:hypothetical protein
MAHNARTGINRIVLVGSFDPAGVLDMKFATLFGMLALASAKLALAQGVVIPSPIDPNSVNAAIAAAQARADAAYNVASAAQTTAAAKVDPSALAAYAPLSTLTSYAKTVNAVAPNPSTGDVSIPVTQFVSGFTPSSPDTVANLIANAPCNAARVGMYAVVSNLYSSVSGSTTNEVARCGATGSTYYWRPQRTDYSATVAYTGGSLPLTPLLTPPVLYLTGTLASNGTITPSTVNAWPGEQFQIIETGALGLFSLQIGGLLGTALNFITGGTRTMTYSCNTSGVCGWQGT